MRSTIVGLIAGIVIGVALGARVIAPSLPPDSRIGTASAPHQTSTAATSVATHDQAPDTETTTSGTAGATADRSPTAATPEDSQPAKMPPTVWNLTGTYAASLPQLGEQARHLESKIGVLSAGALEMVYHDPDTLLPADRMVQAVESGAIDAVLVDAAAFAGRAPAARVFAGIPFGPSAAEMLAWLHTAAGQRALVSSLARHNLHPIPCGLAPGKSGGWFRTPLTGTDDLIGLRVSAQGYLGRILKSLGAEVRALPGKDLFSALESDEIDAVAFSTPTVDLRMGFHRFARHTYVPNWAQPTSLLVLAISPPRWQSLSPAAQGWINAVCGDNLRYALTEGLPAQHAALRTLQQRGGEIHPWPGSLMEAFRLAWNEILKQELAADEAFREVWTALETFRRQGHEVSGYGG